MNFQFTLKFYTLVLGVISLTSCQPPTPRVVKVEAPSHAVGISSDATVKTILSAFDPTEQVIQVRDLHGLLTNFSTPDR